MARPAFWCRRKIPAALAQALNTLIVNTDLAGRLGAAGKAHFQANYSEEPVIKMYLDLCHRLKEEYAWRTQQIPAAQPACATPATAG